MAEKKLESFKIGDKKPAAPASAKKKASAEHAAESEARSLGFARIEKILEEDQAGAVAESLGNLLKSLEEFHTQAKSNKDKAAAQKAMAAVERTADLMDYLFQTKASMLSSPR